MFGFLTFIILLIFTYIWGSSVERSHLKNLEKKERELSVIDWTSVGKKKIYSDVEGSELLVGHVVIAQDYFKVFVASLINLVGGNLTVFESLLERGRREALCRLREECLKWGGEELVNVRFETSTVGVNGRNKSGGCFEFVAYGTALRRGDIKLEANRPKSGTLSMI